jgi:thioredoxin reductase
VLHCPYCHGWEVAGRRLAVLAMSAAGLHQVELVRQLSDDVTVFAAETFDDAAIARLSARDIRIVQAPVRKVSGRDGALIVTTDDAEHVVDAMFTGGSPVLDLAFAAGLQLARADGPGSPLVADLRGATSHPRVFAAGNVTAPFGNVPLSMGAGSMAGAGVNAMLVAEDFTRAMAQRAGLRVG